MNRRSLILSSLLVVALAFPLTASQFVELPMDELSRQSTIVVRATVGPVTSQWDDAHEVIFSSANLTVRRYLAGSGPAVLSIREVGGTVGNYTQEAIGFPALREGEEVVLFLRQWDDGADYRIHAFSQGKLLVRGMRNGVELVSRDTQTQGHQRMKDEALRPQTDSIDDAMSINELEEMVNSSRAAVTAARQQ